MSPVITDRQTVAKPIAEWNEAQEFEASFWFPTLSIEERKELHVFFQEMASEFQGISETIKQIRKDLSCLRSQ